MATPQGNNSRETITIVLAGKSGAGKSTLMSNLLAKPVDVPLSADSTTQTFVRNNVERNGVDICIIDTAGLAEIKHDNIRELKKLSKFTNDTEVDLLIYCLPVGPGHKFAVTNPVIMTCLTNAYGKSIWKHCILVFTLSNLALNTLMERDEETAIIKYKDYIKEIAVKFQDKLHQLKVDKNVKVTTTLHMEITPDTIIATPAGNRSNDLKGLKYEFELPDGSNADWIDVIFALMIQKGKEECTSALLKYRYGAEIRREMLQGMGTMVGVGATAGGALGGAALGATVGLLLGPVGAVAGGVVGGIVLGAATGTAVTATIDGAVVAGSTLHDKMKLEKELADEQKKQEDQ